MNVPKPPSPPSAGPPVDGGGADDPIDDSLLDELPPAEFQALQWSVRMSDGLSPQARAEFEAWLNADPAHRTAYEDVAGVWDAIGDIPPSGNAHIRAALAIDTAAQSAARSAAVKETHAVHTSHQPGNGLAPEPAPPIPSGARPPEQHSAPMTRRAAAQAFAAVATFGVLGGGGWLGWGYWQRQPVFSRHYASERGFQQTVELPDGSTLQLDTATQVDVTLYRNRREVRLTEGQVFFLVQADAAKPFDVLAGAARVTVVGTKFSVRYTPSLGSHAVQVAVSEGKVRVAANGGAVEQPQAVILTAGQAVTADEQGQPGAVIPVAADSVATWRNRRLSFDGMPLAQVLDEIGRYGDIGVRVRDPAVGGLPVTASVDLRNVGAFVQALPGVLPVRLERRENGMEIVGSRR
jgi:transmembrane sensor